MCHLHRGAGRSRGGTAGLQHPGMAWEPFSLALLTLEHPHELRLVLLLPRPRTEVNNSPRQEAHLEPNSHIPAGPNPSPRAEHGFKLCCEPLKRPWRCILAWETAELQITARGEQRENNRDGWAELGAAYARGCTRHGQAGRAGGDRISL